MSLIRMLKQHMAEQFYEQQLKRWVGEQTETSGRTTQPNGAHKVDVYEVLGFLKRTVHHQTFCIRNFNHQGRGAVNIIFNKQNVNSVESSTETEAVTSADDLVPLALFTRIFWEKQGHESKTTVCQDNASAMLLKKNDKESFSKNCACQHWMFLHQGLH